MIVMLTCLCTLIYNYYQENIAHFFLFILITLSGNDCIVACCDNTSSVSISIIGENFAASGRYNGIMGIPLVFHI